MKEAARASGPLDDVLRFYLSISKKLVMGVSITMLIFMVAANALEIIARALFQKSFGWVQETSILAAMWVYFLAYALIAKDDEYIRVEFLANFLGEAAQRWVKLLARVVTIGFYAAVAWFAMETWQFLGLFRTSVLDWPESLFVLPLLIGTADIFVTELIYLYWQFRGHEPSRMREILPGAD